MIIGVLKEPQQETRVSLLPEHLSLLQMLQSTFLIESSAGEKSFATDEKYIEAGATISSRKEVISKSDIVLSIHLPEVEVFPLLQSKIMLGIYQPFNNASTIQQLKEHNVKVFSIDMIPRITRAQSMDVLSSQANIAGYKAVIIAANLFPRYFPMFITAAGSIAPAKVLILGAGVAGLQAIATAKRLGAIVEVFDTRPAVKEEVMSLGGKFIEVEGAAENNKSGGYAIEQSLEFLNKQQMKIAESVKKADIIITTAQIFAKKAPVLITEEMIASMKNGSVIIDLAASTGGNTSLTVNNETVVAHGVSIIGDSNLPATMPYDASKLYGKNIGNFLQLLISKEGVLQINHEDELIKGTLIT